MAPMVAAELGAILTDEPALAVAAGHPVAYEFVIFGLLVVQGHWNEEPILEAIRTRRFGLMILTIPLDAPTAQERWSPSLIAALKSTYSLAGSLEGYFLYRPTSVAEAEYPRD